MQKVLAVFFLGPFLCPVRVQETEQDKQGERCVHVFKKTKETPALFSW
jgi:hypothetical protein